MLVGELAQRAYQASLSHPQGAAFRGWLDSIPALREQSKSDSTTLLTRPQHAAWKALMEIADLYFGGTLRKSRIEPRNRWSNLTGCTYLVTTILVICFQRTRIYIVQGSVGRNTLPSPRNWPERHAID